MPGAERSVPTTCDRHHTGGARGPWLFPRLRNEDGGRIRVRGRAAARGSAHPAGRNVAAWLRPAGQDVAVQHVPDDVAATLTPEDVRRILDFQLEFFQRRGVSGNGSSAHPPGDVVVGGTETVEYILSRASATGESYLPEQVHAVIKTQIEYLRAIGAVGPAAEGPDEPPRAS